MYSVYFPFLRLFCFLGKPGSTERGIKNRKNGFEIIAPPLGTDPTTPHIKEMPGGGEIKVKGVSRETQHSQF